ncbi:hypothetical protein B484DRAFT_401096 [Ochromonadaceae sp. CCMP2298]|nr:hypothetical protein B484DRAFT_401096 [Ochromonadaceae sp. CCMP2298]
MSKKVKIAATWDGKPITSSAVAWTINFVISSETGDLMVLVDAPFFDDPAPPQGPGKYALTYEYEVVEVMVAAYPTGNGYNPYLELQIGPHGHYNIIFFLAEGDHAGADSGSDLDTRPSTKIDRETMRWSAEVAVPSFFLPEPVCGDDLSIAWMMNCYAMHGGAGSAGSVGSVKSAGKAGTHHGPREYLAHAPVPGAVPNFHQLACFVPLVLYETLEQRMTVDRSVSGCVWGVFEGV